MRLKARIAVAGILAAILFCSGCAPAAQNGENGEKPVVAVSIVPEATFVKKVCGDRVKVVTLVPPGASPESYEPSPGEMEEFSSAKAFFAIGVPVEDASLLPKAPDGMKIIRLQEAAAKVYPERTFESGGRDPHIWLSPKRVKVMVQAIAEAMGSVDPEHKAEYAANAKAYNAELSTLDTRLRGILSSASGRTFLVFHPAFGYFADEYGLNMVALEQEGKESTAQHMQELVDLAKKDGACAIFYQAETDSKQAMAFAEEIGGKAVELAPLSGDYENNLITMAETIAGEVRTESKG